MRLSTACDAYLPEGASQALTEGAKNLTKVSKAQKA